MPWCLPFAFWPSWARGCSRATAGDVEDLAGDERGALEGQAAVEIPAVARARSFAPLVLSDDRPELGVSLTDRRIHLVAPGLESAAVAEGEGVKPLRLTVHQLV